MQQDLMHQDLMLPSIKRPVFANPVLSLALGAVIVLAPGAASAQKSSLRTSATQAAAGAKAGTLACDISAGIGIAMAAKKRLVCLFTPAQPGTREVYSATLVKAADPGVAGEMLWDVYAPANRRFGRLSGSYGNAPKRQQGAPTGAHALVGGAAAAVTLQPVSLDEKGPANLAPAVAVLELHPAR